MANEDEESRRWILVAKVAGDMKGMGEMLMVLPAMSDRLERVETSVEEMKGELAVHRVILKELSADMKEMHRILAPA